MYDELRKKAQEKVNHKKGVYIHLVVIFCVSILLTVMSFIVGNPVEIWLLFPILPLVFGFIIHYVVVFGIPGTDLMTEEWEEDQLDLEMWKLYMKRKLKNDSDAEQDELDLKQLEKIRRQARDEDFV